MPTGERQTRQRQAIREAQTELEKRQKSEQDPLVAQDLAILVDSAKRQIQGIELRGQYANSLPSMDAREYQVSGLIGANFDDGRGNVAVSVDYSNRQSLGKLQRKFSPPYTLAMRLANDRFQRVLGGRRRKRPEKPSAPVS